MNTSSIISHRMFVAALSHDESAVGNNLSQTDKLESRFQKNSRDGQLKELTPHQLMLALMSDGFEPWDI